MNSWKIILATVIIFGAGVVVGGLLTQHIIHLDHPRSAWRPGAPVAATNRPPAERADLSKFRQPDQLSQPFLQKLDAVLQLTPVQYEAVEKLIHNGQQQIQQVMQEVRQQIREQLNPDQLKPYEKLLKQQARPPGRRSPGATNAPAAGANSSLVAGTNAPAASVEPAAR